jgi:hypothetical protein
MFITLNYFIFENILVYNLDQVHSPCEQYPKMNLTRLLKKLK